MRFGFSVGFQCLFHIFFAASFANHFSVRGFSSALFMMSISSSQLGSLVDDSASLHIIERKFCSFLTPSVAIVDFSCVL